MGAEAASLLWLAAGLGLAPGLALTLWGVWQRRRLGAVFEAGEGRGQGPVGRLWERFGQSGRGARVRLRLEQAGLSWTAAGYGKLQVGVAAAGLAVGALLGLAFWVGLLLGVAAAKGVPEAYLAGRRRRRTERLEAALPEGIGMLANAMAAGMSVGQSIKSVAGDVHGEVRELFGEIGERLEMGATFEEAVGEALRRNPSGELEILFAAITMQRETGGNLVEGLERMAQTLRERRRLAGETRVLTAESRFVAFILPLMPVGAVMLLNLLFKGYLATLFTVPGIILVVVCGGGYALCMLAIRRVANIRV